jgi:hypothetical protein
MMVGAIYPKSVKHVNTSVQSVHPTSVFYNKQPLLHFQLKKCCLRNN